MGTSDDPDREWRAVLRREKVQSGTEAFAKRYPALASGPRSAWSRGWNWNPERSLHVVGHCRSALPTFGLRRALPRVAPCGRLLRRRTARVEEGVLDGLFVLPSPEPGTGKPAEEHAEKQRREQDEVVAKLTPEQPHLQLGCLYEASLDWRTLVTLLNQVT